ncbi:MAG: hypothetical protein HOB40_11235 [Candidatus Marinimicrobia bacterium]|jgi:hypothetical protein|nr:hypothetical protein [Candidatus Neomarinimicrobiota bacterium]MBT3501590.1 hypothetical protein [Candidatus Neomarinimicrobiota bacterium]MBT3838336.1 hypothetical protein [Candidatus Neomarinimicrobiota bacterium]MBT3998505.1 hypothetical protein [Candidatus Neomarinimicrobiota bacterium]MBT4283164.1 hypothetical protein [Candidatus Neomarinimicrobiota bacterium]
MFMIKPWTYPKILSISFLFHLFLISQTIHNSKINRTATIINDTNDLINLFQSITQNISNQDSTKRINIFSINHNCNDFISQIPYNEILMLNNWKLIKAISISNLDKKIKHDFGIIIAQPIFKNNICVGDTISINYWMDYHKISTNYDIYLGDIMWKKYVSEQWDWFLKYADLEEADI